MKTFTVSYHTGNPLTESSSSFPADDIQFDTREQAAAHLKNEGFTRYLGEQTQQMRNGVWQREFFGCAEGNHSTPVASIENY